MQIRTGPVVFALALFAGPAIGGDGEDCNQTADSDLRITGCTAVINIKNLTTRNKAAALNARGVEPRCKQNPIGSAAA